MDLFELEDDETYDKRCGEIFLTTKGNMAIHCTLCEVIYKNFESYFEHLYKQHETSLKCLDQGLDLETYVYDDGDCGNMSEENTASVIYEKIEPMDEDIISEIREELEVVVENEAYGQEEKSMDFLKETFKLTSQENQKDMNSKSKKNTINRKQTTIPIEIPEVVRDVKKRTFIEPSRTPNEARKHKCPVCFLAFKDRNNMRKHLQRHSNDKNHSCPMCSKKFYTPSEVKIHLRSHTSERNFLCSDCGKSYKTNFQLTCHVKRHKNQRDFKCEVCDKAFFDAKTLKDHMVVHSAERPFVCSMCSDTFPRILALKNHMKLHENKRAYKCHLCKAGFNQQAGLLSHMKANHKIT